MRLEWRKIGERTWIGKFRHMTYTLDRELYKQSWNIVTGGIASSEKIGVAATLEYAKEMAQEDADDRWSRAAVADTDD